MLKAASDEGGSPGVRTRDATSSASSGSRSISSSESSEPDAELRAMRERLRPEDLAHEALGGAAASATSVG